MVRNVPPTPIAFTSLAGESTATDRSDRSWSTQSYAPWSPLATKTDIPAVAAAAIELAIRAMDVVVRFSSQEPQLIDTMSARPSATIRSMTAAIAPPLLGPS